MILLTPYVNMKSPVYVQDKFGICKYKPSDLVRVKKTNISSAVNKHQYFVSRLVSIWGGELYKINSCYENDKSIITIDTPFGLCRMIANNLLNGRKPDIRSAICPTTYLISQFNQAHNGRYDYGEVEYVNDTTPVKITCHVHGVFEQLPTHHKRGIGCMSCANASSNWSAKSYKNKVGNRESQTYIIKCWNSLEVFYKVGITCTGVFSRYNHKLPYNYEVVDSIINLDAEITWQTEKTLNAKLRSYSYIPNIKFPGYTECFIYRPDVYTEFKKLKKQGKSNA